MSVSLVEKYQPEQIQIEETAISIALKTLSILRGTHQSDFNPSSKIEKVGSIHSRPSLKTAPCDIIDSNSLALKHGATGYDTTLNWAG